MSNIDKIRQALYSQEFDAILITDPVNRLFATGFESSDGVLLVTAHGAWFYTDSRYIEAAESGVAGAEVLLVTPDTTYFDRVSAVIAESGLASIGFEDGALTYAEYVNWSDKLAPAFPPPDPGGDNARPRGLVPAGKMLSELRSVKSREDLLGLKFSQSIAEKSFEEILPVISTDMTEKELAAELLYRFLKNGADDKSFDTIVVSGPKSSMPHGAPGDVKISKGFLTIDFGVRVNGWCSDTTRTLCVGKPDEEMIKVYDTVLEAQLAGISATRAGVAGVDVDKAARRVIEDAGFGGFFGHGFGHGVGLEVHESPTASVKSKDILQAGAVISAEPGIYLPGRYGVRIEDVLYVTDDGCENITSLPKELIII